MRGTLPVDFEYHRVPGIQVLLHLRAAGAVQVVEDFGRFQQRAACFQALELVHVHEQVIDAVCLVAALLAGRIRNREPELGMTRGQRLDQRRLAGARWRRDHEQPRRCAAHCHVSAVSLDVLDLFAHLLDQDLEVNRRPRGFGIARF